MSSVALTNIRGYLASSAAITNIVPKKDISIGHRKTIDNFPCIIINQRGGTDKGFLGYGLAGSRLRKETILFSLDIYSRTSRKQTYTLSDLIVPIMIASGSCEKLSDNDNYDDELSVYRKTHLFSYTIIHND